MARQNYFVGGLVSSLVGSVVPAVLGGGSGISAVARGGGKSGAAQAFLERSSAAASEGKKELKDIQLRNAAAAEKAAAILNGYLQEKPREQRQDTQERLRNFSLYR
jgi:curli biogenesis system outer membrane secretion channel CsgG